MIRDDDWLEIKETIPETVETKSSKKDKKNKSDEDNENKGGEE